MEAAAMRAAEEERAEEEAAKRAAEEAEAAEEAAKKAAEEKRKAAAARKAAEEAKRAEEAAKKAEEDKRAREEAAKQAAEKEKAAREAAKKAAEEKAATEAEEIRARRREAAKAFGVGCRVRMSNELRPGGTVVEPTEESVYHGKVRIKWDHRADGKTGVLETNPEDIMELVEAQDDDFVDGFMFHVDILELEPGDLVPHMLTHIMQDAIENITSTSLSKSCFIGTIIVELAEELKELSEEYRCIDIKREVKRFQEAIKKVLANYAKKFNKEFWKKAKKGLKLPFKVLKKMEINEILEEGLQEFYGESTTPWELIECLPECLDNIECFTAAILFLICACFGSQKQLFYNLVPKFEELTAPALLNEESTQGWSFALPSGLGNPFTAAKNWALSSIAAQLDDDRQPEKYEYR